MNDEKQIYSDRRILRIDAAILACNLGSGQPTSQPDLAATITAQALDLEAATITAQAAALQAPSDTPAPGATLQPADTQAPANPPPPQNTAGPKSPSKPKRAFFKIKLRPFLACAGR